MTDTEKTVIRQKSDAELRAAGFWLGRRKVTREECNAELEFRKALRDYSAKQRGRGEF